MARYVGGTLVGNWLLFLQVPAERDHFREQIDRVEGWTLSALAVVEGAFERGIRRYVAHFGTWPDVDSVTAAFNRYNGKFGPITPAAVAGLMQAAQSGTAATFDGFGTGQRLLLYSQLFAVCMVHTQASEVERAALIIDAEEAAIVQGWEPDLAPAWLVVRGGAGLFRRWLSGWLRRPRDPTAPGNATVPGPP